MQQHNITVMDATTIKDALRSGDPQLLNKLNVDEVELILPVPQTIKGEDGVIKEVTKETEGVTKETEGVSNGVSNELQEVSNRLSNGLSNAPDGLSNESQSVSQRVSNRLSNAPNGLSNENHFNLSNTALDIIELIVADNQINRKALAEQLNISTTAVQKHINKLKSLGFLMRVGSPNNGYWKILK